MTPFQIPNRGKTAPAAIAPTPVERALSSLVRAVGKQAARDDKLERERRGAFGESIDGWIEQLSEKARLSFFAEIEVLASKAHGKRIATHPLRPAGADALVEKMQAEAASEADAEQAQKTGSES